jgi:hypothetical protein
MTRRSRYLALALLVAAAAVSLTYASLAAQRASTTSAPSPWTAPLTADGHPDLQGHWTNDTYAPLERPEELGDTASFTPEEAQAFLKSRVDRLLAQPASDIHYDDAIWQAENYDKTASLRTSLITEPRNGRLPPLTREGEARLSRQRNTQRANGTFTGAPARSLAERCITWGHVGPPMMPPTYYANLEIMQTSDQILIRHELMDSVRTIYLDGRPHPARSVQWLAGHSVGRWDRQTLVVDTTNFTDQTNFRGSPQHTRQDIFATAGLHVVERFTRTSPDLISYEFEVEDPATWTSPWSGALDIRRVEGPIYEYACHEGNYGLANILRATLVADTAQR